MPLLRAFGERRSAIIAVQRLTFPLLIPPTILERRKTPKVLETAHSAYDVIKPTCRNKKEFLIEQNKVGISCAYSPLASPPHLQSTALGRLHSCSPFHHHNNHHTCLIQSLQAYRARDLSIICSWVPPQLLCTASVIRASHQQQKEHSGEHPC